MERVNTLQNDGMTKEARVEKLFEESEDYFVSSLERIMLKGVLEILFLSILTCSSAFSRLSVLRRPVHDVLSLSELLQIRKCRSRTFLEAIQVKIYGTKNAYTTLRPYDVVLYKMDEEIDGKETALGLYLGGPQEEMRLLCCDEDGGTKFHVDHNYEALNAQALQNNGQILRVITADRVRDSTSSVMIEEWLSGDIFIPIGDGQALFKPKPGLKLDNLDNFLSRAEEGVEMDPLSMLSDQPGASVPKGGGVTLEALENEVIAMEEQLNKILGMISRLKRQRKA